MSSQRSVQLRERLVPDLKIATTVVTGSIGNFIKRFMISKMFGHILKKCMLNSRDSFFSF